MALALFLASAVVAAPATAQPTLLPCAPPIGSEVSFRDAFATDLTDAPVLRFIDALRNFDERRQRAVFEAASKEPETRLTDAVAGAVYAACRQSEVQSSATRAVYLLAHHWNLGYAGKSSFEHFSTNLAASIGALAAHDRLGPDVVDATLAPFGIAATLLLADPPPPPAACDLPHRDARVVTAAQPNYPPIARREGLTGIVRVKVGLSAEGLVESVSVYQSPSQSPGGDALEDATIFSAAESTFAPEVEGCRPTRGSYIYRSDFVEHF